MSEAGSPPQRRRPRLRRILRWLLVSGCGVALLVAGLGAWAWFHRMDYLNRALASAGSLRGSARDVTLNRSGAALLGFELRDAATNDLLLSLPEVSIQARPRDWMQGRIRRVTVNDAEISITEPFLERLLDQRDEDESAEGLKLPPHWKVDRVELRNARLRYLERDGTREEIVATFQAEDVSTGSDGMLSVGAQELTVNAGGVARGGRAPLTLERLHAHGEVHEGNIVLEELSVERPSLNLTPEFLDFLKPDSPAPTKDPAAAPKPSAQQRAVSFVHSLRIGRVKLDNIAFSATGFTPGNVAGVELPEMKARVSYETSDFEWSDGSPFSPGAQWLRVEHLELKPAQGAGSIACRSLNLVMPPPRDGHWTVGQCTLREPEITWTPDLHHLLLPAPNGPVGETPAATADPAPWSVLLENVELHDARVSFADAACLPLEVNGTLTLSLRGLSMNRAGVHSKEEQSLELEKVILRFPGQKPFFELAAAELALKPDAWNESRAVEKLILEQPVVRLRDQNTPWFGAAAPVKDVPPPAAVPSPAAPEVPPWQRVHFGQLKIADGSLDFAATPGGHLLDAQAKLVVTTDPAKPGLHRVRFEEFEARLPGLTLFPFPVARVSFVECAASVPDLWSTHRLEQLVVDGASIEAGEALMKFFEQPAAPAGPQKAPGRIEPTREWTVGQIRIGNSEVTLHKLVPGMDSVKFGVVLDVKDAPLSPEGLAADVAPQRVELANLQIPSPYGGPPVAKLDSVFVNFSPAGLIAKRIDKVEIVSPTLFIGEPLFWYVDYYRRYAAQAAPGPEVKVAGLDKMFALQAAAAAIANEPPASSAGWNVRTLQVHSGKLVIAPKGVPLKGFRTPFPFSFTSEVTRGTLQADFEIPPDNYEIPELKLAFEGLTGKVQFNLPVKGRDNNVTETFNVKRIRWKEAHLEDAFLSVTYDLGGIYGKFGGGAYGGYVNGEFNIYNDPVYSWDGWISGKDVETQEITRKMFPGYFFMEGRVAANLTAVGDGKEVYQADGRFENHTPGKISIEALNDLIKKLPESVSGLKLQLSQITLETLRDFAYDAADGRFRTYGREGRGTLKFTGPTGTRGFEINAYDHRWKIDPKPNANPTAAP